MEMKDYFNSKDTFLHLIGGRYTQIEKGKATVEAEIKEEHITHFGRDHAHAGYLFTLAEAASAAAVLSFGYNAYAVDSSFTITDAVTYGKVIATAKTKDNHEEKDTKVRVRIESEDGRILAMASFVAVYTGETFDFI